MTHDFANPIYGELKRRLLHLTKEHVEEVVDKERAYGRSWIKRGGIGAFMVMARKWDRIENILNPDKNRWSYNIIEAGVHDAEGIIDDIRDLRGYLMLIEDEIRERRKNVSKTTTVMTTKPLEDAGDEPGPSYVNQDPDLPDILRQVRCARCGKSEQVSTKKKGGNHICKGCGANIPL